jgi:hypothetical protein
MPAARATEVKMPRAAGKFDQYNPSIPYAPLARACHSLVHRILEMSDEKMSQWRAALLEALGPNGQLMVNRKKAAVQSLDPVTVLSEGWDDYLRFGAARPRLYAAMKSRVLKGAQILAAEQAFALLIKRIAAIAAEGRLALTVEVAADLVWASGNAATLLYVMAQLRKAAQPTSAIIEDNRDRARQAILTSAPKGMS